jgi:hypothetical protein
MRQLPLLVNHLSLHTTTLMSRLTPRLKKRRSVREKSFAATSGLERRQTYRSFTTKLA